MRVSYILMIVFIVSGYLFSQPYYVDPVAGVDTNPGTIGLPLKTIGAANTKVGNSGGYIYLRGGNYSYSGELALSKVGSAGSTINIWAYNNELPVLDFAGETVGSGNNGINLSGDYYHLKGLEIMHADHNGIKCTGHYNIIEACKIHSNRNSGFQFDGGTNHGNYASHNLILNTDSYLNFDPPIGGNADGFSLKWYIGKGNVCRGCRSWQNSDDGWDLWMADSTIELDSCFAFRNGVNSWGSSTFDGNGNGFKLGGNYVATPHIVKNCVSFDNAGNTGRGFDENNDTAGQTLYNCVAYRNTGDNYHFTNNPITGMHIIKNCISYIGNNSIINATLSNNSWPSLTPSVSDFVSIDTSLASAPRQANGNLPDNGFFRLNAGSKFIDAGVYIGIPFMGSAPDIGAFEYKITTLTITALLEAMYVAGGTAMTMTPGVTVELHDAVTLAVVETKTATLSTAGVGSFLFTKATNGTPYYIVVKGPTTVETWSATAHSFTAGNLSYDFTSGVGQAYTDGSMSPMSVHSGKTCIYSGDVNQDGQITSDDFTGVDNDNSNFDYHIANDVNGDGQITSDDFTWIDNNNTNFVTRQVPPGAPQTLVIYPNKNHIKLKFK
ncbi:MAG: dockerin type I repeat-containing protein [Ignavibacteriaceae bacterium]|nr:dockerin type I repeat-containing protein [Ignavibacteriaceae bacterium]